MALLHVIGRLCPRQDSHSGFRWQRIQGISIYPLTILANAVHTQSDNVTDSIVVNYSTIYIPDSTMEILFPLTSIPTPLSSLPSSSSSQFGSFDLGPSTTPYPSSSLLGSSLMWTSNVSGYTTYYTASEVTLETLSIIETPSTMLSSPSSTMLSTPLLPQSSIIFQASQIPVATSSLVSSVEMVVVSSQLGNPSSQMMSQTLSTSMSSMESPSPSPSLSEASLPISTQAVMMQSSVSMPTTTQAFYSPSLPSSPSPSSLYSSLPPVSYMPAPSSISLINPASSVFITTQSLSPTPINSTPSPTCTMESSSQPTVTTAGPDQLSILEWFGIAVGGAAVLFIIFLLFHCYQLRQRTIRRQKKQMKKEILDFSQSGRNDRISSWRNSLALDAMAMHIELPREDSMDMQAMDNNGFEEVFLGDEPKSAANNNYFLPQTNL